MLSSANTNVGLTHYAPWNSPGEPKIYYPTGVRNYARVAASDDYQGPAMAPTSSRSSRRKNVFIVHDNQTFGKGVAQALPGPGEEARHQGARLRAVGCEGDRLQAIGQQIKDSGAESVYLGGIVCNNGVKLLKDLRVRARDRSPSSLAPTAGPRTRRPSGPARRLRACTSATRASRSRSSARRARSSSPG